MVNLIMFMVLCASWVAVVFLAAANGYAMLSSGCCVILDFNFFGEGWIEFGFWTGLSVTYPIALWRLVWRSK